MDLQQLHDRVNTIEKSHSRVVTACIVAFLLILAIIIFKEFYGHNYPEVAKLQAQIKQDKDSLKIHDLQRAKTLQILESQIAINTSRTTGIEQKVNSIPATIKAITTKYDKQHQALSALSDDEQFSIFANWISETDTL